MYRVCVLCVCFGGQSASTANISTEPSPHLTSARVLINSFKFRVFLLLPPHIHPPIQPFIIIIVINFYSIVIVLLVLEKYTNHSIVENAASFSKKKNLIQRRTTPIIIIQL